MNCIIASRDFPDSNGDKIVYNGSINPVITPKRRNPIMTQTKCLLALLLALLLLTALPLAMAEEAGNVPQRGLILPLTQEDAAMGLSCDYAVMSAQFDPDLPVLQIFYTDQELYAQMQQEYLSPDLDEASRAAMLEDMRTYCRTSVGDILLLEKDLYDSLTKDAPISEVLGVNNASVLGENDGHVYVCVDYTGLITADDPVLMERLTAAITRANELMTAATFQPLVFAEGEFDAPVNAFPTFTTTDLSGNTVTNEIFAGKDLTVVNIWGTYCGPCIEEMDELAAWSASMPENVQLVGLVSDLYSLEDAETLEMAQLICESTGADNYLHLVTSVDFYGLMTTVVGVPTTYFVDSTGAVVGQPIVGADVPGCIAFVEDYLNAQ